MSSNLVIQSSKLVFKFSTRPCIPEITFLIDYNRKARLLLLINEEVKSSS